MSSDAGGPRLYGELKKIRDHYFDKGRRAAVGRQYHYAIELFLTGLSLDPYNVRAHKELRAIALKRLAAGVDDLRTSQKMMLKAAVGMAKNDVHAMLNAEQLLAYDPANRDMMLDMARHAKQAGIAEVAAWSEQLARNPTNPE